MGEVDETWIRKILPLENEEWGDQSAMKKELLQLHADFCKIFSNPRRLEILCLLRDGELTSGQITEELGVTKANASQHLALMRIERILSTRRDGINVYYGIANKKICQACSLMQEGLEQLYGDAPEEKRKRLGMQKEEQYDQDSKKCINHVLS
jgi:ArsR family transcriptional regulator, virulence genes transcriptional regulator